MMNLRMKRFRIVVGIATAAAVALMCSSSPAFFHAWRFSELFSTASGDTQFIELRSTVEGEIFSSGAQIKSMSTGKVFNWTGNLSGSTLNRNMLLATAGFGALPGAVAPDFTLPSTDFFNQAGDTLLLCTAACNGFNAIDTRIFSSVPTDGVLSRIYPANTLAGNSPANLSTASGSINRGDYNANGVVDSADYVTWRKTLSQTANPIGSGADGNNSGAIDLGDHTVWRSRFGNAVAAGTGAGTSAGIPEPATIALATISLLMWAVVRRRAT